MKTPRASLTVTKPCIIHSEVQVDSTAEGKSPLNVFSNIPGKGNGRCEEKGHGRREKQKIRFAQQQCFYCQNSVIPML